MKKIFRNKVGKEVRETIIEELFDYKGFKCMVVLNKLLVLVYHNHIFQNLKSIPNWRCGYIGIEQGHPLYKMSYEKIEEKNLISTFRGLTYSEMGDGKVFQKGYWWIGFDTMFLRDTKPLSLKKVKELVKELAEQLTIKNLILRGLE